MSEVRNPVQVTRHASWLELLFDLVVVAFVGQVAYSLHDEPGWGNFAFFMVLFFPAWWAWVNITVTVNLLGEDNAAKRWTLIGAVMVAFGVMAAAVPEALAGHAWAYALGNAVIRLALFVAWWSARHRIGVAGNRPMLFWGATAALWAASALVPAPWQLLVWLVAIVVEVVMTGLIHPTGFLRDAIDSDHLGERVGLFVVIVFGESIIGIVAELQAHWTLISGLTAVLAFIAVILLGWVFFHYGTTAAERGWGAQQSRGDIRGLRDTVMYLPFIGISGVAMFAVGLATAVAEADHHLGWGAGVCIAGGLALFYLANALISLRYGDGVRRVLAWGIPCLLLPLLPLTLIPVAPAVWIVVATALVLIALIALAEWRLRHVPPLTA